MNSIKFSKNFDVTLSIKSAFESMINFLGIHYERTRSDDIGGLLGDMMFVDDKYVTMDPAAWHDWINSVEKNTGKKML